MTDSSNLNGTQKSIAGKLLNSICCFPLAEASGDEDDAGNLSTDNNKSFPTPSTSSFENQEFLTVSTVNSKQIDISTASTRYSTASTRQKPSKSSTSAKQINRNNNIVHSKESG